MRDIKIVVVYLLEVRKVLIHAETTLRDTLDIQGEIGLLKQCRQNVVNALMYMLPTKTSRQIDITEIEALLSECDATKDMTSLVASNIRMSLFASEDAMQPLVDLTDKVAKSIQQLRNSLFDAVGVRTLPFTTGSLSGALEYAFRANWEAEQVLKGLPGVRQDIANSDAPITEEELERQRTLASLNDMINMSKTASRTVKR